MNDILCFSILMCHPINAQLGTHLKPCFRWLYYLSLARCIRMSIANFFYVCRCEFCINAMGKITWNSSVGFSFFSTKGWQNLLRLSLCEAANFSNPCFDFISGWCNYKRNWENRQCSCQQKSAQCSNKCHKGSACSNQPLPPCNLPSLQPVSEKRPRQFSLTSPLKKFYMTIADNGVKEASISPVIVDFQDSKKFNLL